MPPPFLPAQVCDDDPSARKNPGTANNPGTVRFFDHFLILEVYAIISSSSSRNHIYDSKTVWNEQL